MVHWDYVEEAIEEYNFKQAFGQWVKEEKELFPEIPMHFFLHLPGIYYKNVED